jgi:hypothetical protein
MTYDYNVPIFLVYNNYMFSGTAAERGLWDPRHTRYLDHTKRRTTVGRTPLGRVIVSSQRPLPDNTQTNIHAPGGLRTEDRSRRAAADLGLRSRGHWDRPYIPIKVKYSL